MVLKILQPNVPEFGQASIPQKIIIIIKLLSNLKPSSVLMSTPQKIPKEEGLTSPNELERAYPQCDEKPKG